MKKFAARLVPRSMAGQLIAVLLLALIVAQIASLIILYDDRRLAFAFLAQQEVLSRTASVTRLLNQADPELHPTIVDAASSRRLRFQLSEKAAVRAESEEEGINQFLQNRLAFEMIEDSEDVRIAIFDDDDDESESRKNRKNLRDPFKRSKDSRRFREWRQDWWNDRHGSRRSRHHNLRVGMTLSVATKSGAGTATPWLNVYSSIPPNSPAFAIPSLVTIGIMAVLLIVIVIIMIRRLAKPLARLTHAAERFGRGEDIGELPENGPVDIRKATRAFNEMQDRLTRFVKDRTRMLAAITHDIRTPITSLRIRAEMIDDLETREKILETLAEMQALTEAALDFAKEAASQEETRSVDLIALVESLCQDLLELGQDVAYQSIDIERLVYACRPMAFKRALRNVIENAVRYGEKAEVSLEVTEKEICIKVVDHGPGVSLEDQERIFEPFVRLEESRSRDTGGVGLGLAIARTIIRAQGGDVTVLGGEEGSEIGATFTLVLPRQD